ncbi:MAG: hypothetical protein WD226_00620 [Planctomycetota bacterium]
MANVTIAYGLLLIVIGALGYLLPADAGQPTALIPAYCGAVFLVLGALAKGGAKRRKIVMHIAVLLGVLLIVMTITALGGLGDAFSGEAENAAAIYARSATALLSIGFVALAVRSFIVARKSGGMAQPEARG